jgi:hypothetical protein
MFVIHNHVVVIFVLINEHVLVIGQYQVMLMLFELLMDNVMLNQIVVNFVLLKMEDFHQQIFEQLLTKVNVGILVVNENKLVPRRNIFLRLL